jgi:hypothetical protein
MIFGSSVAKTNWGCIPAKSDGKCWVPTVVKRLELVSSRFWMAAPFFFSQWHRSTRIPDRRFRFILVCHKTMKVYVYYAETKRELNRIRTYECRCHERPRAKAEGSTRLAYG